LTSEVSRNQNLHAGIGLSGAHGYSVLGKESQRSFSNSTDDDVLHTEAL
jgi:hypothetical protein